MPEEDYSNVDREGFNVDTYRFIKNSNELNVITNLANASLYQIRNQCTIFSIDSRQLISV